MMKSKDIKRTYEHQPKKSDTEIVTAIIEVSYWKCDSSAISTIGFGVTLGISKAYF